MQKITSTVHYFSTTFLPWALFLAGSLPLLVLAYLGFFTRYLADDYSIALILSKLGFWQAQVYWYQNWLGKFTHTFLVTFFSLGGVPLVRWLPMLALLLWSLFLFGCLGQALRVFQLTLAPAWRGLLVVLIMFGTLKSLPEYQQVVFWQSGISDYMSSVVLSSLLLSLFLKRILLSGNRPLAGWEMAAWFVAIFISGGCSETWAAMQVTWFTLGLLSLPIWRTAAVRRNAIIWLALGFLAACLAFVVMAKAPGNMNRDTVVAELSFNLVSTALLSAFLDVNRFLFEWVSGQTTLILLLFLAGLGAGFSRQESESNPNRLPLGLLFLAGAFILLWAGFAPRFAAMGTRPPDRAIFTPLYLFILTLVFCGLLAGDLLRSRLRPAWPVYSLLQLSLFLLVGWLPLRAAVSYATLAPELRLYAHLWDERDTFLRQAAARGEQEVIVNSLRSNPALHAIQASFWIEGDLQEASDNWINQEAAAYYGLTSISLRK